MNFCLDLIAFNYLSAIYFLSKLHLAVNPYPHIKNLVFHILFLSSGTFSKFRLITTKARDLIAVFN